MSGYISLPRRPGRLRRGIPNPFALREFILILGTLVAVSGVFVGSALLGNSFAWAPYIPLGLVACGLAAWLVLAACYGSPTAIMLYFGVFAFVADGAFRIRGAGEITADWQSLLKFAIWLGAGVIGFAHMPPLRQLLTRPACAFWLAYIVIAMTSSIYSPIPGYSFGCAVALLCLFAFAFALTTRLSEGQLLWTLLLALTVFNIGGWIAYFAVPELGVSQGEWQEEALTLGPRMAGLAGQATELGSVCATAVGTAFLLWYTRRAGPVVSLILGGFAFMTLLQSNARTSEIATVVGIGLILASRSAWLMSLGALAGSIALLLLQMFPGLIRILALSFSRTGDPNEIATLTGRTQIWEFCWQQIARQPILGYGYNSTKVLLANYFGLEDGVVVDTAHNLFLQSLISVGILGTIPLVIVLGYLTYRMIKRPIPIVCYMLVTVLISGTTDTSGIATTPSLMTVMLFVASVWPGLEGSPVTEARPPRGIAAVHGRYRTLSS